MKSYLHFMMVLLAVLCLVATAATGIIITVFVLATKGVFLAVPVGAGFALVCGTLLFFLER